MRYDPKNDNIGAFRLGNAEPTGNRDKSRQRLEPFKKKSRNPCKDVKLPLSLEEDLRQRAIKTLKQSGMTERQAISSLNATAKQLQAKNRFPGVRKILSARGLSPAEVDKIIDNIGTNLDQVNRDISMAMKKYLFKPDLEMSLPHDGVGHNFIPVKSINRHSMGFMPNVIDPPNYLKVEQAKSRYFRQGEKGVEVKILEIDVDRVKKHVAEKADSIKAGTPLKLEFGEVGGRVVSRAVPEKNDKDTVDSQNQVLDIGFCVLGEVSWDAVDILEKRMQSLDTPLEVRYDIDFSQVRPEGEPVSKAARVMSTTDGIHPYAKDYSRRPAVQVYDEAHLIKPSRVHSVQDIRDALNLKPKKQVPR